MHVNTEYDGCQYLMFTAVSSHSNRELFTVKLMPLFSNEYHLNQGRFISFVNEPQENHIKLELQNISDNQLRNWIGGAVEWVAENTSESWSLEPVFANVSSGYFDFSFANTTTAVTFALVWL